MPRSGPVILAAAAVAMASVPAAEPPPNFEEHVLPVFREKCCACHNPDQKKGGLDLSSWGQTMAGGSSGEVIAPGDPDGSYLLMLVTHASEPKMPPESDKLPEPMVAVISKWIAGGAIERNGSQPVARKRSSHALDAAAAIKPDGPPVMPPRLSLDVVTHGRRPTAVTALAASPHGALLALGGASAFRGNRMAGTLHQDPHAGGT